MIAYKVVEKRTRYGSNIAMFKHRNWISNKDKINIRKNKNIFPRYFKGKIIKAKEGTPGIFFFEGIGDASLFMFSYSLESVCKIIRIKTIGDITRRPRILFGCGDNPFKITEDLLADGVLGICYSACPAIEVLE
jgi:hypothetical protein